MSRCSSSFVALRLGGVFFNSTTCASKVGDHQVLPMDLGITIAMQNKVGERLVHQQSHIEASPEPFALCDQEFANLKAVVGCYLAAPETSPSTLHPASGLRSAHRWGRT